MTDEGVFPKSDGDICYASEVNRFNPKPIGRLKETSNINVSGAGYVPLGSILYDASASEPTKYMFGVFGNASMNSTVTTNFKIRFSGAGLDLGIGSVQFTNVSFQGAGINVFLGSGAITASGGNIGSNAVFFAEGKSSTSSNLQLRDLSVIGW